MDNSTTPPRALLRWLLSFGAILLFVLLPVEWPPTAGTPLTWLALALMVALTVNAGLVMTNRKLHAAYSTGLLIYLTLGEPASWGSALLVMALGAFGGVLAGQLVMQALGRNANSPVIMLRESFQMAAQLVLALAAGAMVYDVLDGRLPLTELTAADAGPLAALIVTTLGVYLFQLRVVSRLRGNALTVRAVLRHYSLTVSALLLLPLPFVIVAAYSYHQVSALAFWVLALLKLAVIAGIYNHHRYHYRTDQQVRELTRLTRFSNTIRTSLDLETLLQTVYLQVSHLLNINNMMVVLQDPASEQLQYLINVQNGQARRVPREVSMNMLASYVIEHQSPLLINDKFVETVQSMNLQVPTQRITSWLGVPLASSDRTRGTIIVYTTTPNHHLTNDDRRRLSVIAVQVGVAIDNALLYEQSRTRVQQLRDLNEAGAQLSGTLDRSSVLDSIVTAVRKIMHADGAAIFMWEDNHGLVLARAAAMSDGFVVMPPAPMLARGEMSAEQDVLVVTDAGQDERVGEIWVSLANEGKRAWAEMLLHHGDDQFGVLVVYYNEPQPHTQQDVEMLRTFARQAALALSNARLYSTKEADLSRRVEQLSLLQRLSQALFLGTLKLEEMYHVVLQRATEGTEADTAVLFLTHQETPQCVAQIGYRTQEKAETVLHPLMEEAFRTGEMVLVPDTEQEATWRGRPEVRSQMAIPILADIRVIGAILLESRQPNAFGPEDMFFVMQVGTQARIAIENIKLIQSIATTRDRLQTILNSMSEAIILISPTGHVSMANPQVKKLLQLDPGHIINRPVTQLLEAGSFDFAYQLGFEASQLRSWISGLQAKRWTPDMQRTSYDLMDGTRRRFIDRVDIPVDSGEDTIGWMMVFLDVTEERELAQARADLSNMIVHDLRGPLNAINMSLKLMGSLAEREEGSSDLAGKVTRTTETSRRAVRKMLNLVNSLLDVAKMESGTLELEREPTDIRRVVDGVLEELSPIAYELDIELANAIEDDAPLLDVDAEKIERTLLNLVDNALKFTPGDGQVTVSAEVVGAQFLQVRVADTGPGVPDEYKETLFDRYAQVKNQASNRSGTGLGLTFCRLTVEAHGGRIWIEDNPEGGAVFIFTLPTVREELLQKRG